MRRREAAGEAGASRPAYARPGGRINETGEHPKAFAGHNMLTSPRRGAVRTDGVRAAGALVAHAVVVVVVVVMVVLVVAVLAFVAVVLHDEAALDFAAVVVAVD